MGGFDGGIELDAKHGAKVRLEHDRPIFEPGGMAQKETRFVAARHVHKRLCAGRGEDGVA